SKILKLAKKPLFKEVILEGFCHDEVVRYTGLSADPSLTQIQRDDALRMAHAGGLLKRWIQIAERQQEQSLNNIKEYEAELHEYLHADPEEVEDENVQDEAEED